MAHPRIDGMMASEVRAMISLSRAGRNHDCRHDNVKLLQYACRENVGSTGGSKSDDRRRTWAIDIDRGRFKLIAAY